MTSEVKKPRVMIIDDSPTIRVELTRALRDRYECLGCEDGMDALSKMASFNPDIILVDIVMPKLNGYETVSIIRLNERFANTPVFMLSGKGGVFDVAQGRILGFDGNLTKPAKAQEVVDLIDGVIGHLLPSSTGT